MTSRVSKCPIFADNLQGFPNPSGVLFLLTTYTLLSLKGRILAGSLKLANLEIGLFQLDDQIDNGRPEHTCQRGNEGW